MRKYFVSKSTTNSVDQETGEMMVTEREKVVGIAIDDQDKFYMVFYTMAKQFYNIKSTKDVFLLSILAEMAGYNTGRVDLSPARREEICKELDIMPSNLSSALKRLRDLGLIEGSRGSYHINPANFWVGDSKTRNELLKSQGVDFVMRFKRESLIK